MKQATTSPSPLTIARNAYDEATRVTEAYQIQVHKRRASKRTIPEWDQHKHAEAQDGIDAAVRQLEQAERDEVAAWQRLDHLSKGR